MVRVRGAAAFRAPVSAQLSAQLSGVRAVVPAALIAIFITGGCGADSTSAPPPPDDASRKGVSLSPRSYDANGFFEFAQLAADAGDLVTWAGDWLELADTTAAPHVLAQLGTLYGFTPVFLATSFRTENGAPLRPLTPPIRAQYLRAAASFARRFHPEFLGFGLETDVLLGRPTAELDAFVALFADAYDSVKAASPSTIVLTTFELERMKGLRGGLFGGANDTTMASWALLDRFPKLDLVAFSTYPNLIFGAPNEMPADYYASAEAIVAARAGKPIAISESGWHSDAAPVGWESSEAEQAVFVARLFELLSPASPRFIVWSFVYDQAVAAPFNSIGLRRADGTARPAWDAWVSAAP